MNLLPSIFKIWQSYNIKNWNNGEQTKSIENHPRKKFFETFPFNILFSDFHHWKSVIKDVIIRTFISRNFDNEKFHRAIKFSSWNTTQKKTNNKQEKYIQPTPLVIEIKKT